MEACKLSIKYGLKCDNKQDQFVYFVENQEIGVRKYITIRHYLYFFYNRSILRVELRTNIKRHVQKPGILVTNGVYGGEEVNHNEWNSILDFDMYGDLVSPRQIQETIGPHYILRKIECYEVKDNIYFRSL